MSDDPDTFVNAQIAPGALADYREVRLEPVSSAYVPFAVISATRFWLLLALAVVAIPYLPLEFEVRSTLVFPLLVGAGWFGTLAWLDARRRGWALREHDLIYRSGILWQRTAIVPFARIQHVETTSGPLERLFGLMRVKCFTAGGESGDLTLKGLDSASARRVRQYLLEQIRDDETDPVKRAAGLARAQASGDERTP